MFRTLHIKVNAEDDLWIQILTTEYKPIVKIK